MDHEWEEDPKIKVDDFKSSPVMHFAGRFVGMLVRLVGLLGLAS